jgi:hypothetical protein
MYSIWEPWDGLQLRKVFPAIAFCASAADEAKINAQAIAASLAEGRFMLTAPVSLTNHNGKFRFPPRGRRPYAAAVCLTQVRSDDNESGQRTAFAGISPTKKAPATSRAFLCVPPDHS